MSEWDMARDDGPILAQIILFLRPHRHLEFGTWQGYGSKLVLENSQATVWSINLLDGEHHSDGLPAYLGPLSVTGRGKGLVGTIISRITNEKQVVQTDAYEQVGSLVHAAGLGNRLNQIYCDSTKWETSAYPDGFFDSILIDGGHQSGVVASDTLKSIRLVRQGGVILWHDFCLDDQVREKFKHVETVIQGVESVAEEIQKHGIRLYWINPSWLLCGIKGNAPIPNTEG
jgi:predicted O-methyltransferase YrrM